MDTPAAEALVRGAPEANLIVSKDAEAKVVPGAYVTFVGATDGLAVKPLTGSLVSPREAKGALTDKEGYGEDETEDRIEPGEIVEIRALCDSTMSKVFPGSVVAKSASDGCASLLPDVENVESDAAKDALRLSVEVKAPGADAMSDELRENTVTESATPGAPGDYPDVLTAVKDSANTLAEETAPGADAMADEFPAPVVIEVATERPSTSRGGVEIEASECANISAKAKAPDVYTTSDELPGSTLVEVAAERCSVFCQDVAIEANVPEPTGTPDNSLSGCLVAALSYSLEDRPKNINDGVVEGNALVTNCGEERSTTTSSSESASDSSDSTESSSSSDTDNAAERERVERALALAEAEAEAETSSPLRTKNEKDVDEMEIPPVNLEVKDEHKLVPVGRIKSVMPKAIVVESLPGALSTPATVANPYAQKSDSVSDARALDADTVLVLVESRTAFGRVFETFGPVASPFYIVRFNSDVEIAALGDAAAVGKHVAFIAGLSHLVRAGDIRDRGYDASNIYDEELSGDRQDHSDDEAEATSKRARKRPPGAGRGRETRNGDGGMLAAPGLQHRPYKRHNLRGGMDGNDRGGRGCGRGGGRGGREPHTNAPAYHAPAYGQPPPPPPLGAMARAPGQPIFHNGIPAPSIHPMLAQQQRPQFPQSQPFQHPGFGMQPQGQAFMPSHGASPPPAFRSQPAPNITHYPIPHHPMYNVMSGYPTPPGMHGMMPGNMYGAAGSFGNQMYPPHPMQRMFQHPAASMPMNPMPQGHPVAQYSLQTGPHMQGFPGSSPNQPHPQSDSGDSHPGNGEVPPPQPP
jgi:Gar1/Naf1 RNA binding region